MATEEANLEYELKELLKHLHEINQEEEKVSFIIRDIFNQFSDEPLLPIQPKITNPLTISFIALVIMTIIDFAFIPIGMKCGLLVFSISGALVSIPKASRSCPVALRKIREYENALDDVDYQRLILKTKLKSFKDRVGYELVDGTIKKKIVNNYVEFLEIGVKNKGDGYLFRLYKIFVILQAWGTIALALVNVMFIAKFRGE